jgi:hypothetical protein
MLAPMGNEQLNGEPATPAVVDTSPNPSSKTPLWIALAGLGGLVIGVIGTLGIGALANTVSGTPVGASSEADTRLVDAVDDCGASEGVELGDKDQTLVIDVEGEEDTSGAAYADQACILSQLDMPASVESHLNQTTSMDGRQTESWDGVTIEWSYHPDRGSDMVITLDDDAG